jgi:calcium-dependent protein kinase
MKLTDFGLAAVISNPAERMKDPVGSAYFMAPEVFERNYTLACDAWSMGINLYLLLSGDIPFRSRGGKNVARGVYNAIQSEALRFEGDQWAKISPDAKDLVSGLLEKRSFRRYTIEQALAHPWISGDAASDVPFDQNIINSMCNFYTQNKLRRATLRVLSSMLQADDIRKLRTAFFSMDINADQKLSFDELVAVTKSLGFDQTSKHIKTVLKSIGWDRGHYINIEEFLAATTELIVSDNFDPRKIVLLVHTTCTRVCAAGASA